MVADDVPVAVDGGFRPVGLNVVVHPKLQPLPQGGGGVGGGGGIGQGEAHRRGAGQGAEGDAVGMGVGVLHGKWLLS